MLLKTYDLYFTFIFWIFKVLPAVTIRCYVCSSLDDSSCESNPTTIAVCPNVSMGCTKIIVKGNSFQTRLPSVVGRKKYEQEVVYKKLISRRSSSDVTVRQCCNIYARYQRRYDCHPVDEVTVCLCEKDLCNGATIPVLQILFIPLLIIFW